MYLLIPADDGVEVNGIGVNIAAAQPQEYAKSLSYMIKAPPDSKRIPAGLYLFGTYYGRKGTQPSSAILRPMRTPMTEAIIKPRVQPELSPRQ